MTLLCVAPHCALPRQHTPTCTGKRTDGSDCRGCQPAQAEVGYLCERCFNRTANDLTEIAELYARLVEGWPDVVDDRLALRNIATAADGTLAQWGEPRYRHRAGCDGKRDDGGECLGCTSQPLARDPVAALVSAGNITRLAAPKVSGTPGRSSPVPLDILDLLAPSRLGSANAMRTYAFDVYRDDPHQPEPVRQCRCGWPTVDNEAHRGVDAIRRRPDQWRDWHDQIGNISAATMLDLWAHLWHDNGAGVLPDPTVPDLIRWLSARWDWAVKHLDLIPEFIGETRHLRGRLYGSLDESEPLPEPCYGIACRACHQRNLFRRADATGTVDCHSCGLVLKADEYDRYLRELAPRSKRAHIEAKAIIQYQHEQRGELCPACGKPARIEEVTLANMAGVVRVVFDCKCESLMTPVVA